MPDPFDALRTPLTPIEPEAAFAAQLRARVARALSPTRGVTTVTDAIAPSTIQSADAARPRQGDLAYVSLWVPDAERAATFFSHVLGWRYADAGPSGRARQVGGLNVSHGILGGVPRSTLFLCFTVDDVDAAIDRVRAAGGTAGPRRTSRTAEWPNARMTRASDSPCMPRQPTRPGRVRRRPMSTQATWRI